MEYRSNVLSRRLGGSKSGSSQGEAHGEGSSAILLDEARRETELSLAGFIHQKSAMAATRGFPGEVPEALGEFVMRAGKRTRPVFCMLGWNAAGGNGFPSPVVQAAAALEMFHAFALIHDDVMDRSETRRSGPTVHALFAERSRRNGVPAEAAEHMGVSTAILLGDLALVWSDEMVNTARLSGRQREAVLPLVDTMRTEIMYGQYLDVTSTQKDIGDLAHALRTIRYKTATYTVEWPLRIGAALAGSSPRLHGVLTEYALPIGEAFQLRDDVLGVFGVSEQTGKSTLEDLRNGKRTVLMALAHQRADTAARKRIEKLLGDPELDDAGAAWMRETITATGARAEVERMIDDRYARARNAVRTADLPVPAVDALLRMADLAVRRVA